MYNSHFLAEWGVGLERYQVRLSRVEGRKLRRVVLLGSDGYVSLESLRFISDVGASLIFLDRRGKILFVSGPTAPSDSKLRRAQSLAITNGTALRIAVILIRQKLEGQETLVRTMLRNDVAANAIARFRAELQSAESIESVRLFESQAARAYWQSWSDVPVRWPRKDKVPSHWMRFGSRISPITHSPRLACNPPNSLLNFLYAILEAESTIAISAMGLLPEIGVLHADAPRNSLSCDVMEVCRPKVDAFVLDWLLREPLRKADFWEDRNGNTRIVSSLAAKLCSTADTWRRFVGPIAEMVAKELWNSIPRAPSMRTIATRLTSQNKREVKGSAVPEVKPAKLEHVCRGCGKTIRDGRNHCANCAITTATERLVEAARIGRIAARTPEARARHAESERRHAKARASWDASSQPAWLTNELFSQKIKPLLASIPTSAIRSRIGVSRWYASRIRQGYSPHPRHWQALANLVGVTS